MSELFEKTRVSRPGHNLLFNCGSRRAQCSCVPLQKIEARVAADEDLKLADLLKYYLRESQAAKVCLLSYNPLAQAWQTTAREAF